MLIKFIDPSLSIY